MSPRKAAAGRRCWKTPLIGIAAAVFLWAQIWSPAPGSQLDDKTALQIIDVEPEEAEWCLEILEESLPAFRFVESRDRKREKAALDAKLACSQQAAFEGLTDAPWVGAGGRSFRSMKDWKGFAERVPSVDRGVETGSREA